MKQIGRAPPLAKVPKKYSSEAGEKTFIRSASQQTLAQVPLGRWVAAGDCDKLCWVATQQRIDVQSDWCLFQASLSANGSL